MGGLFSRMYYQRLIGISCLQNGVWDKRKKRKMSLSNYHMARFTLPAFCVPEFPGGR